MGRAFLSQSPTNFHQPLGNTIRRMSRQRFITITYLDISDVVLETRPGLDAEFYGLGLGHGLRTYIALALASMVQALSLALRAA